MKYCGALTTVSVRSAVCGQRMRTSTWHGDFGSSNLTDLNSQTHWHILCVPQWLEAHNARVGPESLSFSGAYVDYLCEVMIAIK